MNPTYKECGNCHIHCVVALICSMEKIIIMNSIDVVTNELNVSISLNVLSEFFVFNFTPGIRSL